MALFIQSSNSNIFTLLKSIILISNILLCSSLHSKPILTKSPPVHKGSLLPIVINTWAFTNASQRAWDVLVQENGSVLDAVEQGCSICEEQQCDYTVGFGGSPDENGETTLDAMIMDGNTHDVGAVGCLRRVKNAISVARKVLENTKHTLLVGDLATEFALKMGFKAETLSTPLSQQMHTDWKENVCQPNFWKNVHPDPTTSCGPYSINPPADIKPDETDSTNQVDDKIVDVTDSEISVEVDAFHHDTIGLIAINEKKEIASGTSSNGARNKIPGRVGDAPIVGAGSYVDKGVGGAAATGDGDVMMRFLPSFFAVERMRDGFSPKKAAEASIWRIAQLYPDFSGAIVTVNLRGEYGAACYGIEGGFPYSVISQSTKKVIVERVNCLPNLSLHKNKDQPITKLIHL